jgi:predicted enzyme related to lactoylglutathione lyase
MALSPRENTMPDRPRLLGIELYFNDLPKAKRFFQENLGLELIEDDADHHAKFDGQSGFICVEKKGVESYPSQDKAVIFLEVADLQSMIGKLGAERFAGFGSKDENGRVPWAAMHDPEGYNVLLIQAKKNQ